MCGEEKRIHNGRLFKRNYKGREGEGERQGRPSLRKPRVLLGRLRREKMKRVKRESDRGKTASGWSSLISESREEQISKNEGA